MEELIKIHKDHNGGEFIYARDLHQHLKSTERFNRWFERQLQYDFIENEDYLGCEYFHALANQTVTDYKLSLDCAKEISVIQRTKEGKILRKYILNILKQRQNLELFNAKEAAFAYKAINSLKYVVNQILVKNIHQKAYIDSLLVKDAGMYARFNEYRNNIIGHSKKSVDKQMIEHCVKNRIRMSSEMKNSNMSNKLSILDPAEAIRVAVIDMLYAKGEDPDIIEKFGNMVKEIAKEANIEAIKENKQDLFRDKEIYIDVKKLM